MARSVNTGTALATNSARNIKFFKTRDFGAARAELTERYAAHEMYCDQRSSAFQFLHAYTPIKHGCANFLHYGSEVDIAPDPFGDFYMLEMPLEGGVDLELANENTRSSDTSSALFIPPKARFASRWRRNTRQFMVQFNAVDVQARWRSLLQDEAAHLPTVTPVIEFESTEGWRVKQALMLLKDEFERGLKLNDGSLARSPFSTAVLDAVLDYIRVNHEQDIVLNQSFALPGTLKRALNYIDAHLAGEITIADLVTVSGTGERSLFNQFSAFLQTSPRKYVETKRLENARRLLLDGQVSVQCAARQSGFRHMGRFSQSYSGQFGERPSETLSKR